MIPTVTAVHSLLDFYVQQQSWVYSQLPTSHLPYALRAVECPPSPLNLDEEPPKESTTKEEQRMRRIARRRTRLDAKTHLYYLPRRCPLARPRRPVKPRRARTASTSTLRSSSRTPSPPSNGLQSLLAMYNDMIGERMKSCVRLEQMVRNAHHGDYLATF